MGYDIQFGHKAAKQFADLESDTSRRVAPLIDALADEPRPHTARNFRT
jgi:hypothetical protein